MNRRKFLAFLAAGGVVTAAGLWMPGQKLISIPRIISGNRLLTIDEITREALRIAYEKLKFYQKIPGWEATRIGATLNIRIPTGYIERGIGIVKPLAPVAQ